VRNEMKCFLKAALLATKATRVFRLAHQITLLRFMHFHSRIFLVLYTSIHSSLRLGLFSVCFFFAGDFLLSIMGWIKNSQDSIKRPSKAN